MGLRPTQGDEKSLRPATTLYRTVAPSFVIPRGCDFFDFSCFWYTPPECFSELPQDRHPERSASRIYRLTEGLQRVVEGPRGCLLADALHSFPATKTMREIKKSQPPSEAEGSAVPRSFRGNVFRRSVPGFPASLHWTRQCMRLSLKERRMMFDNASNFYRKSGVAEWRDLPFPRSVLTKTR
jgi:hypothetical protein